jgi:hypothetical protein
VKYTLIILFTCLLSKAFSQQIEKVARKEFERNMIFPLEAIKEKESCIAMIQTAKSEQNQDTLIIINNVREYFRKAIVTGLATANRKSIFSCIASNSIIIISFVYSDDKQFIGTHKIKLPNENVGDLILKMKENKNSVIYDPIVVIGYSNRVIKD